MGNHHDYLYEEEIIGRSKLSSVLPITSSIQQQYMKEILLKRPILLDSIYICSVKQHQIIEYDRPSLNCEQSKKLIILYDQYDYSLSDLPITNYKFTSSDIFMIIHCIGEALFQYRNRNLHHGDISLKNIVRKGNIWQLVDKIFIQNGINAYERVLQGEKAFISPNHMERIRHGFIKQSPHIEEADDIFSLGMVILQLGSRRQSIKCYRESFNRFYDKIIDENIRLTELNYSRDLALLVKKMLEIQSEDRITLDSLRQHPAIANINKFSLKNRGLHQRQRGQMDSSYLGSRNDTSRTITVILPTNNNDRSFNTSPNPQPYKQQTNPFQNRPPNPYYNRQPPNPNNRQPPNPNKHPYTSYNGYRY